MSLKESIFLIEMGVNLTCQPLSTLKSTMKFTTSILKSVTLRISLARRKLQETLSTERLLDLRLVLSPRIRSTSNITLKSVIKPTVIANSKRSTCRPVTLTKPSTSPKKVFLTRMLSSEDAWSKRSTNNINFTATVNVDVDLTNLVIPHLHIH